MNIKHNIRLIYIYAFMVHTLFMLPIIVLYFKDYIGLTFQQFLIGEAVFAAVIIAMEVPSGWMSDVWSRKHTLAIGCFFAGLGYACLLFARNFEQAILSQAFIGIGVAFNSGTVTTLIYDTLATNNKTHLYQKLEGKRHAIGLYAVALASVLGGILYQIDGRLPLIIDVITIFIAMICALLMTEPERVKRKAEKSPIHDMIVTVKYALHGHKEIAAIILVSTVLFCSTKMFMWTQQPYMQYVGIPEEYFGYIIACGFLFSGFMGHVSHRFTKKFSNRQVITFLALAGVILSATAIVFPIAPSIIFILAIAGIWGFGFPFVQNAINKHADPARRATILSTLGLLISVAFIPASIILGWFSENYSILWGLGYLAVQLLFISIIGLWWWKKSVNRSLNTAK